MENQNPKMTIEERRLDALAEVLAEGILYLAERDRLIPEQGISDPVPAPPADKT